MKKENKGITLIALVITIIVLLILTGVTIVTLTGDNGIIAKADNAQTATKGAEGLEKLKVEVLGSYDNNGQIDTNQLRTNLQHIDGIKTVDDEEITDSTTIELPMIVKIDGNEYIIKSSGTIKIRGNRIDEYDVANNPVTYYGSYVTNYNSPYDEGIADDEEQLGKWQIFMADEDNIYLIASNYINRAYAPERDGKSYSYNTSIEDKTTVYGMWWNNDVKSYYSIDNRLKVMLKFDSKTKETYHKWLNNPDNLRKSQGNIPAVINMLDIDFWKDYLNTKYGKYAIGGLTLEMFCVSYNQTHSTKLMAKEDYEKGYLVQYGTGNPVTNTFSLKRNSLSEKADNMLFNTKKVSAYHIASTSAYTGWSNNGDPAIWKLTNESLDGYCWNTWGTGYTGGFRPVVCLKNNVHLIEHIEGDNITYTIELD